MLKIRPGVFETNSSSTHSIVWNGPFVMDDTVVPNEDGIVVVQGGEFGGEWFRTNKAVDKLKYAYQDGVPRIVLKKIIQETLLPNQVVFDEVSRDTYLSGSYIDHNSSGTARKLTPEQLKEFIFSQNVWLLGGNDNENAPPGFHTLGEPIVSPIQRRWKFLRKNPLITNREILKFYRNGNCSVILMYDGSRIVVCNETPVPQYPLSVDVRLGQYCPMACLYCYEDNHCQAARLTMEEADEFLSKLEGLPAGMEIAVGINYIDPIIDYTLKQLADRKLIVNITINQLLLAFQDNIDAIQNWIIQEIVHGIGISYRSWNYWPNLIGYNDVILHVIAGLDSISEIKHVPARKLLILGYKKFGRGQSYYDKYRDMVDIGLKNWKMRLPSLFHRYRSIAFDTLAAEQLNLRRFFGSDEEYDSFMQPEWTMYVDVPNKSYKKSSTSEEAIPWDMSIAEAFQNVFSPEQKTTVRSGV